MPKNEIEISGVPDELPTEVKKNLKKKEGEKKPNIQEWFCNLLLISSLYQAIHIDL